MVMHNGANLTKLRPGGIRSVYSPRKRNRGPRDHPLVTKGRVHDTCRQKLVIRLYATKFENPSRIGFGRMIYPRPQEKCPVSEEYQSMCIDIEVAFERADTYQRYVERYQ